MGAGAPLKNSNSLGNKGGAAPLKNQTLWEIKVELHLETLAPRRLKRKQTHYLREEWIWSAMAMISKRCLNFAK